MLKILDGGGDERFELLLGKSVPPGCREFVLEYPAYGKATGLELDECRRLTGRPLTCRASSHTYSNEATQEIILNWGL